jgi:predicted TIM-barrel fold metal-dependent hydrolase
MLIRFAGRLSPIALCAVLTLLPGGARQANAPPAAFAGQDQKVVEKFGVPVKAGPMDAVLLKDYAPESSLKVPETHPAKARFPVIDVHAHVYARTPQEVAEWVRTMDETGVELTVVLTGAVGAEFDRLTELYLKPYPKRFQLYCGIDTRNVQSAEFPDRAVGELIRCYEKGARGVGEISDKGWGIGGSQSRPVPRDQRLHPDDARLDKFWEKCAELKMPVNLHIADHPSCWEPLGPRQERTPDFQVFNLHGKDVPGYEELLRRRDRMLARHPNALIIACHFSNQGNDLSELSRVLDRYPNLMLDISARDYELGRQPRSAGKFLAQYSGRVLFGTDMGREKTVYLSWWRLLETSDEFIPGRIWWRYYGLDLSSALLEKLYRGNARRLLNWTS